MAGFPENPVLLVDDEEPWLHSFALTLRQQGINNIVKCSDSRRVLELLSETPVDAVVLDLTMPYLGGEELLKQIGASHPALPVIILSGMNQLETAVNCMKAGAFDYFVKTAERERLVAGVQRAIDFNGLKRENQRLRERMLDGGARHEAFSDIVTTNLKMRNLFGYLEAIAPSDQPVLITGESGSGKELFVRAVHRLSRPKQPLVAVNVAGLDDDLFADTLFGHVRGAFTGADSGRQGMIEEAQDGTLFLDEIGDLSLSSQVKLLRLIQEGEFFPVGSDRPKKSRARLVFATNVNLEQRRDQGAFRNDLYYRLCTHQIEVPPLRERFEDLPLLVDHFLRQAATGLGKRCPTPPPELLGVLRSHPFPGNVRELQALIHDAVSLHQSGKLSLHSFRQKLCGPRFSAGVCEQTAESLFDFPTALPTLADMAQLLIAEAMQRADGNQRTAAAMLGISQQALSKRLKKLRA